MAIKRSVLSVYNKQDFGSLVHSNLDQEEI